MFACQGVWSATGDSATYDETPHIVAGLSYLETGDFRLNPEHPPLAKMWAAIPLALEPGRQISTSSVRWSAGRQWELGFEYLNGPFDDPTRRNPAARLVPARSMMVALGVMLCLCVFGWSREVWGDRGAYVSLTLCAFSPTILAHTRLVTTDVPAALGIVATLWAWARFAEGPSWPRGAQVGLACGAAVLVKFTSLILAPMLVALAAIWVMRGAASARAVRLRWAIAAGSLTALIAILMMWAVYGFRYEAAPGSGLPWALTGLADGRTSQLIQWCREWRVLPESYLYGLAYVVGHASGRATYLNGHVLAGGSWLFFPEAFLLKTTPAVLVACAWLCVRAGRTRRIDDAVLRVVVPLSLLVASALASDLNIGHRHLVPLYPLLFVLAGGLTVTTSRVAAAGVALVLVSQVASAASTFPRYLGYFNLLAGGQEGGGRYLSDSNFDWGQDLPRLKTWLERHAVESVDLAYFGTADPVAYGISFRPFYMVFDFQGRGRGAFPEPGRYLAVSHSLLQGLYVTDPEVRAFFAKVRATMTPVGRAGDSILIFRMP